ncbi:MAG: hypothetical protein KKD39_01610 [Candidatus Altiarchaeota archaeon]|nr:hypothetical protein [Candidatus Altiarchaeota archaeon]
MKHVVALLLLAVFVSGCICTDKVKDLTSKIKPEGGDESLCPVNYIQVGTDCCLDLNDNSICDKDEETETTYSEAPTTVEETTSTLDESTTLIETTSTIQTTSTVLVTTTAPPQIACSTNSDCGERREERICKDGDVYLQSISPYCRTPGSPQSECINKVSLSGQTIASPAKPIDDCDEGCQDGFCL